ncbi:hypothetical protein MXD81_49085 [Microbacteriaceae bacterium K1510]|nr:hypothetical protein [Microbacteriaceae bacterium K1510]
MTNQIATHPTPSIPLTGDQQAASPVTEEVSDPRSADGEFAPEDGLGQGLPKRNTAGAKDTGTKRKISAANKRAQSDARNGTAVLSSSSRILARAVIPMVTVNRRHVPPELLRPIEATGALTEDHLPQALMTLMTALGSATAPTTTCEPTPQLGHAVGLGIRLCLAAENRDVAVIQSPVVHAVHLLQNELIDRYRTSLALATASRRAAAERRALHAHAVRAADKLGHSPPPPLVDATIDDASAPPLIVVHEGGPAAIADASAGGTNVLLVDERRMPVFARSGCGDPATAALLNGAAIGYPMTVHEHDTGHVTVRNTTVAVLGVQIRPEFDSLSVATADALRGVAFVSASAPPPGGDYAALGKLMQRVYALTSAAPVTLKFSEGAVSMLLEGSERWSGDIDARLHPLSTYIAQLPDLGRRLAIAVHLASAAQSGNLASEIATVDAERAVALIDHLLLPTAVQLLGAVSTIDETEADARRLVSVLRAETSPSSPALEKRDLQRAVQATMRGARFRAALQLLDELELIGPAEPPSGRKGEHLAAAPAIHS